MLRGGSRFSHAKKICSPDTLLRKIQRLCLILVFQRLLKKHNVIRRYHMATKAVDDGVNLPFFRLWTSTTRHLWHALIVPKFKVRRVFILIKILKGRYINHLLVCVRLVAVKYCSLFRHRF